MSPWRIRSGRASSTASPPPREAEGVAVPQGRDLCLHGGPAILHATPNRSPTSTCGYDVIGMTAMPEAKLAREAEITYATLAMVTDFDCWHPEHDAVDVAVGHRRHARQRRQGPAARGPARARISRPSARTARSGSHRALDTRHHDRPVGARSRAAGQARRRAGRVLRAERRWTDEGGGYDAPPHRPSGARR